MASSGLYARLCHAFLVEINNVVDNGHGTVDAIQGLRPKLHQFNLSVYLFANLII